MKKLILATLLFGFFGFTLITFADVPFENFENYSTGSIGGQGFWTAADSDGGATINTDYHWSGSKSLKYKHGPLTSDATAITYDDTNTTLVNNETFAFWYRPEDVTNHANADPSLNIVFTQKRAAGNYNVTSKLYTCFAGTHRTFKLMSTYNIGNGGCYGNTFGDMTEGNWYYVEIYFDYIAGKFKGRVDQGAWSPEQIMQYGGEARYIDKFQWQNLYYTSDISVYDDFGATLQQLTVSRSPEAGGGVASSDDEIQCGVNQLNYCQTDYPLDSEVELEAFPNSGYVFAYWEWNEGASSSTNNPETFTMDGALGVTAKFYKTFRCAAGDFYRNIDDTGGWCTDYVEYETGIDISGNACDWYDNAITAGYCTGSEPESSAIIVFNDNTLQYGHVGIVISYTETTITIRDSNWCDPYCYLVKEHIIDRDRSDIEGYIYCTPLN